MYVIIAEAVGLTVKVEGLIIHDAAQITYICIWETLSHAEVVVLAHEKKEAGVYIFYL